MPAYPNPFNSSVTIPFEISSPLNSSIIIFNVLGQKITEFPIDHLGVGKHLIKWNGENQFGYDVGAGIYFAQLDIKNSSHYQKLIYLK